MKDVSKLTAEERATVIAKREYARKWRAKNPDAIKRANERFYLRQAEKLSGKTTEQA